MSQPKKLNYGSLSVCLEPEFYWLLICITFCNVILAIFLFVEGIQNILTVSSVALRQMALAVIVHEFIVKMREFSVPNEARLYSRQNYGLQTWGGGAVTHS